MLKHFDEIKNFLPHRKPFLFIEEIVEVELGKSIHCILKNSADDDFYKGHFPGNPVFPGVLLIEALAQASGILGFKTMDKTPEEGSIYVFAGIDKARFRSRVRPNDKVHLYSTVVSEKKGIWKFDTRAEVDNKVVCSASILCADRKA
jgi:3-hydroxyacyl-[acyl-carrier-protein] dehydratase